MATGKDYYKILGVSREADDKTIRDAYRQLARRHHPDVNPNDEAAEARFKEISEAHACLRDPEKRRAYNQFGTNGEQAERARQAGGFQGATGGFSDIFDQFFSRNAAGGGAGGFHGGPFGGGFSTATARPQPGPDTEQELVIPLEEALYGRTRSLTATLKDACTECDGSGTVNGRRCLHCHATGKALRKQHFEVKVPPGVRTGSRIRLSAQGGQSATGGPPGDLYFRVKVLEHPLFRRDGDDLYCDLPLTFAEAALGTTVTVPTKKGEVSVTIPAGTQGGKKLRLPGLGVPHLNGTGSGDQFLVVRICVPTALEDERRELIRKLAESDPENPRRGMRGKLHHQK